MAWFLEQRRRPQGWRGQTLSSLSLPPPPLIAVFAIVFLFLSLSWRTDRKAKLAQRAEAAGFHVTLFLLFVVLVFVVRYMFFDGRFFYRPVAAGAERESVDGRGGSSPWGVAALVVLLLFLVSYQSYFHRQWFRPLWRI